MLIARPRTDLAAAMQTLRAPAAPVTLVPTMGALHAAHLSLLTRARQHGGPVVASIFVNSLQFEHASDLQRYKRDEAGDLKMLDAAGGDAVWLPGVDAM